ncbi:YncE family protein [Raoultibacter phocaeensis]|uniref:YncE family protein n=1 Tax=Raoultibacter phocaeensis TaxID=2479841 RepID=UPI0011180C66|nr:beta-propeller fold lactonase family protein [Raoultibacter phocaeensis]
MAIVDGDTETVVSRVPVGQNPAMIELAGETIFVGSSGGGEIAAVPVNDWSLVGCVPVGTQPLGLCFDEARKCVYVADYHGGSVHVVDPALGSMVETFVLSRTGYHNRTDPPACCRESAATGRRTVALALAPDGSILYCANYGTYDIARIDLRTGAEIEAFDGVVGPRALVVSEDGKELLLAGAGGEESEKVDSLYVIDAATGKRLHEVFVGLAVVDLCQVRDGSTVYAIARDEGVLVGFNRETWSELGRVDVGVGVDSLAISADGETVYIGNGSTGDLLIVDAASYTVSGSVGGFANPKDVYVLP